MWNHGFLKQGFGAECGFVLACSLGGKVEMRQKYVTVGLQASACGQLQSSLNVDVESRIHDGRLWYGV